MSPSPNTSSRELASPLSPAPASSFQFLFSNFSKQNESQDKQNRYIHDSDSRSRFVILAKIEEDSDDREHQGAGEECLDGSDRETLRSEILQPKIFSQAPDQRCKLNDDSNLRDFLGSAGHAHHCKFVP